MQKFMRIRLLQLFCVLGLWVVLPGWSSPLTAGSYDDSFQRYWSRYIPQHDYQWGVAQCYQESLLEPRARSHVGAMGLCQFMPKTFEECRRALRLPRGSSPYHPQISILCNAWYMKRQLRIWRSKRSDLERLYLAQASYNAGAGNIIRAQSKCRMAPHWETILTCLPEVTGKHSKETVTYVVRIKRWYKELRNVLVQDTTKD